MNDKRARLEKFTPKNADSSSSSCSTSSFSEDETDDKPLKPIKDYLYNRKEMSRQLFMSVKTEKIKMMLPQTLKKTDLSELEELCVNELCGMSKSRVLSILNGKQMLDSSNTSESDDSGPSLEIISDTEAWITDSELPDDKDKVSASKSRKVKTKKIKKEPTASDKQAKTNSQNKNKSARKQTADLVKVKNEKESKSQPQQGESLLDLLELEMRARAIRALIRKEEDIIPNESTTSKISVNVNSLLDQANISLAVGLGNNSTKEADKSSARSKVEEAVSLSLNSNEDEDVVLVVKPTPTINLLSSDSEAEDSNVNISKSNGEKIETSTECSLTDKNNKENQDKLSDSLNINKINQANDVNNKSSGGTNSESKDKSQDSAITKVPSDKSSELYKEKSKKINEPSKVLEESSSNSIILHDEDEIIDLDNYSDDMDEIENDKIIESSVKNNPSKVEVKFTVESNSTESSSLDSSETWATRYYQTDNVQSVIKESKIQSEIRKRLRERQKLSKLNNNSNNNGNSASKESVIKSNAVEKPIEPDNSKPTGSVEEYLALKRVSSPDVKSTVCEQNPTDVKVDNIPGEKIFPVTTENIDQSAGDESTIEQPHVSPSIPVQENS
ncbi:GSCOCG00005165001-RA-CDS [Cotesia congregata]|nr:GSCOCG00005165001-RA-CDS [Cotesia congregata]